MSDDKSFYTTFFYIMGGLAVGCVILIILATNLTTDVAEYKPEVVVVGNIKAVGQVRVADGSQPAAAPTPVAAAATAASAAAPAAARSGEAVYNASCLACHATGAAGAPKLGDAAAWAARIANGKDALMASLVNGLNAMPPRGLCMDCSDDELMAAIDYIIAESQ